MSALVEMLIGKKLTPEEQVKKWRQSIRAQERELDKSVRNIEKEQQNAKKLIKQAAKRNDLASCRILAKEVVASKKAINRIITSKAQLGSLAMSMQQQLAVIKVTGALEKSTQVMKVVNKLMKLPEISHTMTEMSKEMMKDEDIEEEAQEEVDKVLFELTDGLLGEGGIVGQDLPATQVKEDSNKEMEARLKALQSV
ncbi:Charged multivesicular body protein 3 [Boothiomyces macroporosus]|uniref:Charged multivesicular body protein 3 n=1 Tax=Boothiomyces macroporosus TaxID=261099 RepID=A0AAD5UQ71_9FUNG|nr:Charged multivesicular body protein 3 [Boothiomyces macroporosus]KAJ3262366.1 Charged multivesicular body protein 3 [Boothiomyces macroporosus]